MKPHTKLVFLLIFQVYLGIAQQKTAAVTVIPIGEPPNALSLGGGTRTCVFARPEVNSVVVIYNDTSGNFFTAASNDMGNTWSGPQNVYASSGNNFAPFAKGWFPQAVIYNPPGNTIDSNAFFAFSGATMAGSNGTWGGVAHGTMQLNGSLPTQHEILSTRTKTPTTFVISPYNGNAYILDMGTDINGTGYYNDTMELYIGTWNGSEYLYSYHPVHVPVAKDFNGKPIITEGRIAFAPNSLIGYITVIGRVDFAFNTDSVYKPIILKTIDGGLTWVNYGEIETYCGKSQMLNFGSSLTFGPDHDLVVDSNGHAHIIVAIGHLGNPFQFDHLQDWGIFDIYTLAGGVPYSWWAELLAKPQTYLSPLNANLLREYNRVQAATNLTGDKVFFTWTDTDTLTFGPNENIFPDLYVRAYDINSTLWTSPLNLTMATVLDGACTFTTLSPYVFSSGGVNILPLITQRIDSPTVALSLTTLNYINGLEVSDMSFNVPHNSVYLCFDAIAENKNEVNSIIIYPNPCTESIKIISERITKGTLKIFDAFGRQCKMMNYDSNSTIDISNFEKGAYIVELSNKHQKLYARLIKQ